MREQPQLRQHERAISGADEANERCNLGICRTATVHQRGPKCDEEPLPQQQPPLHRPPSGGEHSSSATPAGRHGGLSSARLARTLAWARELIATGGALLLQMRRAEKDDEEVMATLGEGRTGWTATEQQTLQERTALQTA